MVGHENSNRQTFLHKTNLSSRYSRSAPTYMSVNTVYKRLKMLTLTCIASYVLMVSVTDCSNLLFNVCGEVMPNKAREDINE